MVWLHWEKGLSGRCGHRAEEFGCRSRPRKPDCLSPSRRARRAYHYFKALIRDKQYGENLVLLAAAQTREKDAVNPTQMRELMLELKQEYDYVLVDCPAGIEQGFRARLLGPIKPL